MQQLPLRDIRGITWNDGTGPISNPGQRPVKWRACAAAFHLPMDRYYYELLGRQFTLFEMSRCASNCTFCPEAYGAGVRKSQWISWRPRWSTGSEVGIRHAYFMDLEFTVLRNQVVEFCHHLIRRRYDFTWCCQTRLDLVDDELLALMKKAGCRLIHTGVEAGSEEILKQVDKGITMREIETGMKRIHAAGIETACFFIMGFPESDEREMGNIVRIAKKLNPTFALFHVAAPYPGTKLYDNMVDGTDTYKVVLVHKPIKAKA